MWPVSVSLVTLVLFLSLGQTYVMIMLRFSTLLIADTVLISLWILASFLITYMYERVIPQILSP